MKHYILFLFLLMFYFIDSVYSVYINKKHQLLDISQIGPDCKSFKHTFCNEEHVSFYEVGHMEDENWVLYFNYTMDSWSWKHNKINTENILTKRQSGTQFAVFAGVKSDYCPSRLLNYPTNECSSVEVSAGLPSGSYRVATTNSASNNRNGLILQTNLYSSFDDCTHFSVAIHGEACIQNLNYFRLLPFYHGP